MPDRHRSLRRFIRRLGRWRRGSVAVEAVLLFPVLVFVVGATAQFMLFAKHRAMLEQAAFAAARSALAQSCAQGGSVLSVLSGSDGCAVDLDTVRRAAAWALLPAAPASGRGGFGSACSTADHVVDLMGAADLPADLQQATRNKACYAYNRDTLTVTIERLSLPRTPQQSDHVTVSVTVDFKFPIHAPIGLFISDGENPDGTPFRWGSATMVAS